MSHDAAYTTAHHLHRAGRWDEALALIPEDSELRATVLTDRFFWVRDSTAEANQAIAAIEQDAPHKAALLKAQLAYSRLLFNLDADPEDESVAENGFQAAASGPEAGWGRFWLGVFAENVRNDPLGAAAHYAAAYDLAMETNDQFLESHVVRHQGGLALDTDADRAEALLRRSLMLRIALGARAQTAAAADTLADVLAEKNPQESLQWREVANLIAADLGLRRP